MASAASMTSPVCDARVFGKDLSFGGLLASSTASLRVDKDSAPMVPLAAETDGLEEDRAFRVQARDLEGVADEVAVADPDDPADGLTLACALGDRPGRDQTMDPNAGHLSAG